MFIATPWEPKTDKAFRSENPGAANAGASKRMRRGDNLCTTSRMAAGLCTYILSHGEKRKTFLRHLFRARPRKPQTIRSARNRTAVRRCLTMIRDRINLCAPCALHCAVASFGSNQRSGSPTAPSTIETRREKLSKGLNKNFLNAVGKPPMRHGLPHNNLSGLRNVV